jgi:hypothetical protein
MASGTKLAGKSFYFGLIQATTDRVEKYFHWFKE